MKSLPMADATANKDELEKILKAIEKRQLVGAANNTKWNELITTMRDKKEWRPSYRFKSVSGYISGWDVEWWYHLPFPFVGVEWFDIGLHQIVKTGRLIKDKVIDHSGWITSLLNKIGFEFEVTGDVVRIWGYFPKSYEDFPPQEPLHRHSHGLAGAGRFRFCIV